MSGHFLSQNSSSFTGRRGKIQAKRTGQPWKNSDKCYGGITASRHCQHSAHSTHYARGPKNDKRPGERMMGQLERRLEAISGEFNSQEVANTLWAFATMGTKPGERMMGQLERRAEAISEIQSSSTRRLLQTRCGQ
jgi:hypothetical protein